MKTFTVAILAATAVFSAPAAFAQEAPVAAAPAAATSVAPVKTGKIIRTAEGRRVGAIERLDRDSSGTPVTASVIFQSRFVSIPVSTLSAEGAGFVTTLSYDDVRKLR